jgi:peptidoglycan hydrolase-like protein with peptidoglycan-binding domain
VARRPGSEPTPDAAGDSSVDPSAPTERLGSADPSTATDPFGVLVADGADAGMVDAAASTDPKSKKVRRQQSRSQGWGRLLRGNRVIWVMAVIAVVALVAGLALGRFIVSPGQAAADAKAPDAGLITVPVENRQLSNDVTIRGDATYADSVEVKIETGEIGGAAIVTGQVPELGATLDAATVALEVTGRPVIVLAGDLPVYRSLRVGVSGPDVLQLKQALNAVGIDPGTLDSDVFDAATSSAINALYDRVGYPAPEGSEDSASMLRAANDAVASANESVAQAQRALAVAQGGASTVDRVDQDNLVRSAQRAVAAARDSNDPYGIADAEDALALAIARREALLVAPDVSAENAGLAAARQQLTAAQEELESAREASLTYLPASEVLYLPGLPRRVDEITVSRGSVVTGAVMRVSGATLVISASAAESDAKLIAEGDVATLAMPDDSVLSATVTSVAPAESTDAEPSAGRFTVLLTPTDMTPEQLVALQGSNVRVTLPVGSTEGEVLAVPLAALTAGPGGESRVEVRRGDDDETVLVEVTTGLAAEGYVEVTAVSDTLEAGDLVVVGR